MSRGKDYTTPNNMNYYPTPNYNPQMPYTSELQGTFLRKVLCHEITHAAMFSYGVKLTLEQEELLADLLATYGDEIFFVTDKIFKKLTGGY